MDKPRLSYWSLSAFIRLRALHPLSAGGTWKIYTHWQHGFAEVILFLLMAIAMTVIELIAGEIFIVKMHVKLWDYTGNKFNYKGIICPLYSLIWAALGAVYYFFIHPYILDALNWLANNLAFSFFYWIFLWCFCYRPILFPEAGREDKDFCGRERYGHQIRRVQTAHQGKFRGEKREIQIYAFHGLRCKAWRAFEKYRDKQREEQRGYRLNDFISKIKKSDTWKLTK